MRRLLNRRTWMAGTLAGGLAWPAAAQNAGRPRKEPLPADLVKEWVTVAHRDLDRVRELLKEQTALLNAAWDWGGGDWETALGAAAHTGRREIAILLIEHGARMDVFAAAMLGELKTVQAVLDAHPALVDSKGPHGIPLIAHARIGKEPAKEVLEYLLTLRPDPKAG